MAFAYFCLRPAAAQVLQPEQRLPLWSATFARFFRLVDIAVAVTVVTGLAMLIQTGFAQAPIGWHAMLVLGLAMAGVFGHIRASLFPALRRHCAASEWPAAAQALNGIRRLVAFNLVLAALTVAAAVSPR